MLLPPAIGELLSGSTPPLEFLNPLAFVLLAILYGGGAHLVRELTRRWGKGWPSLLKLASAYGVIEEGLACKSFFDPNWSDVGILGSYGRAWGVNWIWSIELTIYHAVVSIAVPILLVELAFPERRSEPWISPSAFRWMGVLFVADVILCYFALSPYRPPALYYGLALLLVAGMIRAAYRLPYIAFPTQPGVAAFPLRFALVGFIGTVAVFFLSWVVPWLKVPPVVNALLFAGTLIAVGRWLVRMSGGGALWDDRHRLALVCGVLAFFILLAPLYEMSNAKRPDNTTGMTAVALAAVLLLHRLWRKVNTDTPDTAMTQPV